MLCPFLEGGHLHNRGGSHTNQGHSSERSGTFAESQVQVEQRIKIEMFEQADMPRLR